VFVSESPRFLHADADSFFASVEQRDIGLAGGLCRRPGVVLAASYEAKAYGIRTR